jgi:hypothetical protein
MFLPILAGKGMGGQLGGCRAKGRQVEMFLPILTGEGMGSTGGGGGGGLES